MIEYHFKNKVIVSLSYITITEWYKGLKNKYYKRLRGMGA